MKVKDLMHEGVTWVEPGTSVSTIAEKMRSEDIGAIPVGENDRLVGMVTDRDIVLRAFSNGHKPDKLTARDVMSEGMIFCRDTEEVDDAVRIMEQKKVRRLPVIDENKRMVGMLSLGDVSSGAPQSLSGEVMKAVSAHHP